VIGDYRLTAPLRLSFCGLTQARARIGWAGFGVARPSIPVLDQDLPTNRSLKVVVQLRRIASATPERIAASCTVWFSIFCRKFSGPHCNAVACACAHDSCEVSGC
jgi:hypothetical protein